MSFIESARWPKALTGRVAQAAPDARIHGYLVEDDLARHYSLAETVLLTLTGGLPDEPSLRAFEVAMCFLAPAPVAHGPSHCAVLAQTVGAPAKGVVATAAIALAEEAAHHAHAHESLLQWLEAPVGRPPEQYLTQDPSEADRVRRLTHLLAEANCIVAGLAHPLSCDAALVATLHRAGIRRHDQLQSALVLARLPCVLAEGFAARHGRLKDYPMTTPQFDHAFDP